MQVPDFPSTIEIQTTSACTARCGVCPHEAVTKESGVGLMPSSTLWKVLEDCASNREKLKWIIPYYNAEPFTDKRMLEVLRFIKHSVGCQVELSTNASLLTAGIAAAIVEERLIDLLRVSAFSAIKAEYEEAMFPLKWESTIANVKQMLEIRSQRDSRMQVEIVLIGEPKLTRAAVDTARALWEPLGAIVKIFGYLDRAGNNEIANSLPVNHSWARVVGCDLSRPIDRMCLLRSGQATLCSQDWRGMTNLGNVNNASLAEIWRSSAYAVIRDQVSGVLMAPESLLCRKCKLAILD